MQLAIDWAKQSIQTSPELWILGATLAVGVLIGIWLRSPKKQKKG